METVATKLRFPLNVYAALMQATAEQSAFLAYGTLQARSNSTSPGADELIDAQRQLADQIIAALDLPAGSRVLEVGSGSGLLARHMADAGWQVTAVDNNEAASKLSTQALSDVSANIVTAEFASQWPQWAPQQYDALIFHNSARYFLPLSCFAAARHLLAEGGKVLIVDEFLTGVSDDLKSCDLAQLENVEALAARAGFLLQDRVDTSGETANFLDAFIALFQDHRQELLALTDESPETISELETAMLDDLKRFPAESRICFVECSGNGGAAYNRNAPRERAPSQIDGVIASELLWLQIHKEPLKRLARAVDHHVRATALAMADPRPFDAQ